MKAIAIVAVGALLLLGVASCSSDNKLESSSDSTTPDVAVSDDISIPDISGVSIPDISIPDISIPEGLSDQCKAWATAFVSVMSPEGEATFDKLDDALADLRASVPDDLQSDVDVYATGIAKLGEVYKKYDYDISKAVTDPELSAFFSDQDFVESSNRVTTWLDTECATGS